MGCSLVHRRAYGDELSLFSLQLTRSGVPYDLTGKDVKFYLYDKDGNTIINGATCSISVASSGYVEYDFTAADYAAMIADTASPLYLGGEETFHGFFKVFPTGGSDQGDTYPEDQDGIAVEIFDPAKERTTPSPSISELSIIELAKSPRRVRTVEGTVEERSVREMILADQYTANKAAADTPPWGMRVAKTMPGSTTSN
jgi:hypothetical protein